VGGREGGRGQCTRACAASLRLSTTVASSCRVHVTFRLQRRLRSTSTMHALILVGGYATRSLDTVRFISSPTLMKPASRTARNRQPFVRMARCVLKYILQEVILYKTCSLRGGGSRGWACPSFVPRAADVGLADDIYCERRKG